MPKEGSNAFYRAYVDRLYLDKANRDNYLYRSSASKIGLSGGLVVPALETVDGVDISVHAADLQAHTKNLFELIRIGQYFWALPYSASTTKIMTADTIYAYPFLVARAMTIDRLAVEVTTGASGKIIRLGIYANGTNLYPGALVKDAGTVSATTAAVVAATISQALTKGLYWLVLVSDGTPTLRSMRPVWNPLGQDAGAGGIAYSNKGWEKASVGSGALAASFVSGATLRYDEAHDIYPRVLTLD